jgi:hypothetical protein
VAINSAGLLLVSCDLSLFSVGALVVLGLVLFLPLLLTSCPDILSSLLSLLLLSFVSEKSAIGVIAPIVVAACDVSIA